MPLTPCWPPPVNNFHLLLRWLEFLLSRFPGGSERSGRPSVGLKIENFTDNEFWKQARKIDHGRADYVAGLRAGKNVPTRKKFYMGFSRPYLICDPEMKKVSAARRAELVVLVEQKRAIAIAVQRRPGGGDEPDR
jgi:hypothetical protein